MSQTNTRDVLKSIERSFISTLTMVTAPSLTILATIPAQLIGFTINKTSCPTFSILDGSVFPSPVLFDANPGTPTGSYVLQGVTTAGLSVIATNAGLPPSFTISWKL